MIFPGSFLIIFEDKLFLDEIIYEIKRRVNDGFGDRKIHAEFYIKHIKYPRTYKYDGDSEHEILEGCCHDAVIISENELFVKDVIEHGAHCPGGICRYKQ